MKARSEFSYSDCPHPFCDCPIRFVYNQRQNTLVVYHGEDEILTLSTPEDTNLAQELRAMSERYDDERARFVEVMGTMLAIAVVDLHREEERYEAQ